MSKSLLLLVMAVIGLTPVHASADAGHDHDPIPMVGNTNTPQRLPDGSVYLPKITQRQLALRTLVAEEGRSSQTFELFGKVTMDPNAGGKVQPTVAGRIEPGPRGLPSLGQAVKKGEVLAFVRPSVGAIERANQAAQAAELRANKMLAEKRLARLQQLEGTVPQKEVDAAKAEVQALTERLAAVGGSLSNTDALVAPASGVIASANVVAGQVVDAREVLFEIVDPTRLLIEAIAHDAKLATRITAATARIEPGVSIPLTFIGAGRSLREQALPILFRINAGKQALPSLTVGQPLTVLAQTDQIVIGYAVPATAIVKDRNNQDIVWVHVGAERFVPRTVRFVPSDGATSILVDGVAKGDRIVVQGASLLNQVR
jgi:cobalt-zinc-cadmium efflux system membrane fusion protein